FKLVVRTIAMQHNLHASFMPKPLFGLAGSGMHVHQSLYKGDENIFYDENTPNKMSAVAMQYLAGILRYVPEFTAITNPSVNSYKRLVPGYEAPVYVAWSERNRSPLVRIPAKRGHGTRLEVRSPDPSCNPYLALAVMLKAGLQGIKEGLQPPEAVNGNIYHMTEAERIKNGVINLPSNLGLALDIFEKSELMKATLGDHVFERFISAKREEFKLYEITVHDWEIERYLRNV
ncbi:MAG: glutamine synthetase, partial [bacterium]|nr:glutamine synthetase [bacterium]